MIISCLHTADSNIDVFDEACPNGVTLRHNVRPDFLQAATDGLSLGVVARTQGVLRSLAKGSDAVLLTCSTLGPAAEGVEARVPVQRVDAALARQACVGGSEVAVICAAPSTLAPTRKLFRTAASKIGVDVRIILVDCAWETFLSGDREGYLNMIAGAADLAMGDVVALAQASMAPAARLTRRPVLTSPAAGLQAAIDAARH